MFNVDGRQLSVTNGGFRERERFLLALVFFGGSSSARSSIAAMMRSGAGSKYHDNEEAGIHAE